MKRIKTEITLPLREILKDVQISETKIIEIQKSISALKIKAELDPSEETTLEVLYSQREILRISHSALLDREFTSVLSVVDLGNPLQDERYIV